MLVPSAGSLLLIAGPLVIAGLSLLLITQGLFLSGIISGDFLTISNKTRPYADSLLYLLVV